ncbi:MAG: hypothetical protein OHK0053_37340 [Microscillaceae bacterium]
MVVPVEKTAQNWLWLDFSAQNTELSKFDLGNIAEMNDYVFGQIAAAGAQAGVGGYNEDRAVYQKSPVFQSSLGARSIHLGVDIWMPAFTLVCSPLAARVHSFRDNANFGDYGPTLILEHQLEGTVFFTLYGHLSRASLRDVSPGQNIAKGQKIGEIGPETENGQWTPHLHFQIIQDMQGHEGDFPGVAHRQESAFYLNLCPDPNLMLGIPR